MVTKPASVVRRISVAIVVVGLVPVAVMLARNEVPDLVVIPAATAVVLLWLFLGSRNAPSSAEDIIERQNSIPILGWVIRFGDAANRRLYGFDRRSLLSGLNDEIDASPGASCTEGPKTSEGEE